MAEKKNHSAPPAADRPPVNTTILPPEQPHPPGDITLLPDNDTQKQMLQVFDQLSKLRPEHCRASFDITTRAGWLKAVNGMSPPDLEFDESGTCQCSVVDYLVFPSMLKNRETGEWEPGVRTILYMESGETFGTWSPYIAPKVHAVFTQFTAAERGEGINMIIRERMGRQKRTYHDVRVNLAGIQKGG